MISNLENIISKINVDSDEKISLITEEANKQMNILKNDFDDKLKIEKENIARKFESTKTLELERITSGIELKCKNILLQTKQTLISETIDKLRENLENISIEEMKSFLMYNLEKRTKKFDDEDILLPKKFSGLLGLLPNIKVDEKVKNGFIIKYKGIEENFSFDSLIRYKREELEEAIQKYFE
ncbi:V-type ATP synthase subunit E [Streptobacillus notomytis]|uniref:V-type ATP synthase subunit E n=1 Tax=Streptobacillus notomytis TaxID=1712031 RepID=UPI0009360501|nr:V-type ATP synthase subunit E [Streptobacillus notomytis]